MRGKHGSINKTESWEREKMCSKLLFAKGFPALKINMSCFFFSPIYNREVRGVFVFSLAMGD